MEEVNAINTIESNASSPVPVAAPVATPLENIPQSGKFCSECGSKISAKAEVCPNCGVRASSPAISEKSKTTAALLAFFLGGLGAHKFYLGRTGMGVLYLVFCWTFVPAIISLVEGIQLLGMSDSEFAMKYR